MRSHPQWMISAIILFFANALFAQNWTVIDPETIISMGIRDIIPQSYVTYNTDYRNENPVMDCST